ncbi:hypothetical protein GJ496_011776 [Pomphorhynchus laevis]|nr:hypothetical protein GJ496_011776 [Pomphorhynchus laevis]
MGRSLIRTFKQHTIPAFHCYKSNTSQAFIHISRKTNDGCPCPDWLVKSQDVLVKRHARRSKFEPLVDTARLVLANPTYVIVRYPNNREAIVSLRYLSPTENSDTLIQNPFDYGYSEYSPDDNREAIVSFRDPVPTGNFNTYNLDDNEQRASQKHAIDEANVGDLVFPIEDSEVNGNNPLRRSKRQRRPP